MNLSTESLSRASASHPWRTITLWVVLIAVAVVLNATLLGDALTTEFSFTNNPDSQKADRLLEERLRGPKKATEIIVVHHDTLKVDEGAFQERVQSLYQQIVALGDEKIAGGPHYYQSGDESLVSSDRHTTIMPLFMAGSFNEATENVEEVLEILRRVNGADGFTTLIAGEASVAFEANELAVEDIEQGEKIGVPIALVILLVLFGAFVAALIPIFLAIVAIIVALGATALLGQMFDLIFFVTLMITMIGLAVGIDYSLIVVFRFREELRRGRDRFDAIARTGATASRTMFFSGVTVVVALSGMLIVPTSIYKSLAVGAILVVISAVAASLTLLPAALALLGERIDSLRVPFIGRRLSQPSEQGTGGFWAWLTRKVMAYPIIGLIVTAGVLIAATVPAFDINTGFNGVDSFPDGVQSKDAFLILEKEFSFGLAAPTEIAIDGDMNSGPVRAAVEQLKATLANDTDFFGELRLDVNPAGDLGLLTTTIAGETNSERATNAVKKLRSEYIPLAFSGVDAEVLVTGVTAFSTDFFAIADKYTPIVFAAVLGLSFVLLTLVFRSIVVPLKAIVMNLLSVGAAYGLMVLVFQKGFAVDLLGFQRSEIIDAWIPLFLFSVLFGLSMDYHLFLLSRIRERFDQTGDNTEAVSYGLRRTAGLITGAALIMVAVFGGFASGVMVSNQQVGFGLGIAILLDATIVRSILVPSSMRLLGNINWYFPAFLHWLPDLRVDAEPEPDPAASDD